MKITNEIRDLKIMQLEEQIEKLNKNILNLEVQFELNGLSHNLFKEITI